MKETTPRPASRAGAPTTFRLARREDRTFVRELALRVFTVYGSYDRYLVAPGGKAGEIGAMEARIAALESQLGLKKTTAAKRTAPRKR